MSQQPEDFDRSDDFDTSGNATPPDRFDPPGDFDRMSEGESSAEFDRASLPDEAEVETSAEPDAAESAAAEPDVEAAASGGAATIPFADLTLTEVLARGVRQPRVTWTAFWETITPATTDDVALAAPFPSQPRIVVPRTGSAGEAVPRNAAPSAPRVRSHVVDLDRYQLAGLILMIMGLALALLGSSLMTTGINRTEQLELAAGAPWVILGFVFWLAAGVVMYWQSLQRWWQRRRHPDVDSDPGGYTPLVANPFPEAQTVAAPAAPQPEDASDFEMRVTLWLEAHFSRLVLIGFGLVLSLGTYFFNGNNTFTGFGVFLWIASIIVWLAALAPADFDPVVWFEVRRAQWRGFFQRDFRLRPSWTAVVLILIMLVGAYFRFARLEAVPPEMTSDHVEKLLDAQRVLNGQTQIFFPNNGGREGLQMYLVALFSQISGLGMTLTTLKWVSILEGLITLPVLWWMGREIIGEDQPRLGNAVGLILAALVAVSYWHVALSRLALRIVLTPLVMALVMIFLARAMRYNRRTDFLKTGVALGVGVYCYQAVRMMPIVVVLGVLLAAIFVAKTWAARRQYTGNLVALALIAIVIFVPLGRFMLESPNLFWMRTAGRFFGDDVITETDPETGELVERDATLEDQLTALRENLTVLGSNIRNVLLMYNWKGDVAWINGAPNRPAMDWITGSLFIAGLAAWLVRMVRRRDVVDWLILPAIFIMLLPSALSIAFPVENPSATRTSGSLPMAYLLAAYGLAVLVMRFQATFHERAAQYVGIGAAVLLIGGAYGANSSLYFGEYVDRYEIAALPYSMAGRVLKGFAESNGSYGNAFMVAYPYWLDHRAIGLEGGRTDWPNGLVELDGLADKIQANMGTPYQFDPNRAVLFFFNQQDEATRQTLLEWFPEGSIILQQVPGQETKDFYTLIAPPPGEAWLHNFLLDHLSPVN